MGARDLLYGAHPVLAALRAARRTPLLLRVKPGVLRADDAGFAWAGEAAPVRWPAARDAGAQAASQLPRGWLNCFAL